MMVDAGTTFGEDVDAARSRMDALARARVHWFEEPFMGSAFRAYKALSFDNRVALAGGEGCHNPHQAEHMIDHAGVRFIQIDTGRVGGITPALRVAHYAQQKGVVYVNHTFTTHLALAASLVPFVGLKEHEICEYPVEQKPLARDLCKTRISRDANGFIRLPDAPGLGVEPDLAILKQYLVDTEIKVGGKILYRTPEI
jgi:L-alanine-DL-glutamate epimerase-like enolase superfamily enzyme